jgi:hypothetical protein
VEPSPLIIDHRLAILPKETQLSQLMRPKPRAFEGQRLIHHRTSVIGEAKKTAFKIVVPRRGIGTNQGEAHETS